jgi:hypothetical protein
MSGDEHRPSRPSWDCEVCGAPWPCGAAREQLAAEQSGTYLILRMQIEMIDAARDCPTLRPGELFFRFIGWTAAS